MGREKCMIYRNEPAEMPAAREATREESIAIAKQYLEKALEDDRHREVYVSDALLWLRAR